jgi:hypothetical protein
VLGSAPILVQRITVTNSNSLHSHSSCGNLGPQAGKFTASVDPEKDKTGQNPLMDWHFNLPRQGGHEHAVAFTHNCLATHEQNKLDSTSYNCCRSYPNLVQFVSFYRFPFPEPYEDLYQER